ncbi:hypothetical protein QJ857_gp1250 [Tupanvirus soda lake]|uniref:VWFA domain-containing protein n=2 Tax=Tupanvirus TaxID=2094720 RepID=A0A6N1NT42_9VIRU|nr:hypothetical protein QJ857_gp1250 [Tupanvirus soda lake]QKU34808.1 hypothetical protein [Tupanvirus soda lake]
MQHDIYPTQNFEPSAPPMNIMQQSFLDRDIIADSARQNQFTNICGMYEINQYFAERLKALEGYEIVIVCDDSGSMNSILNSVNPYGRAQTRWDELKITVGIIVDIAATMDKNGVDVYFLNRPPIRNITVHNQLDETFTIKPSGGTGIVPILRSIFQTKCEAPRLVILATDGQPTDARGQINIGEFKQVLQYERGVGDYVTILACTDEDDVMNYLNGWDKELPRLDVVDDYTSEKEEILKVQGRNFPFSFGDYVVKGLMGSIDVWFDKLDEVKVNIGNTKPKMLSTDTIITSSYYNDPVLAAELNHTSVVRTRSKSPKKKKHRIGCIIF